MTRSNWFLRLPRRVEAAAGIKNLPPSPKDTNVDQRAETASKKRTAAVERSLLAKTGATVLKLLCKTFHTLVLK